MARTVSPEPPDSVTPSDPRVPRPIGRQPEPRAPQGCGLCGSGGPLTRAHVPPQSAGNDDAIRRTHLRMQDGRVFRSSPGEGGMWTRSLCGNCNSMAGGRYDAAYASFHSSVATRVRAVVAGFAARLNFDGITATPSLVARSVLCGMFALSTQLRVVLPDAAHDLSHGERRIRWSEGHRLILALNLSNEARAQGGMTEMRIVPPRITRSPFAEIWFHPLAWALVSAEPEPAVLGPSYFDLTEWVDVTDWINIVRPAPALARADLAGAPLLTSYWLPGDSPNLWGRMYHHDSSTMILGEASDEVSHWKPPGVSSPPGTSPDAGSQRSRTRSSSK